MTSNELKPGDVITFAGVGYTKRGKLIYDGRYAHNGRKAKSKIVKFREFKFAGEAYDMPRDQTIARYDSEGLVLTVVKPAICA